MGDYLFLRGKDDQKDPCRRYFCKLQSCLSANNYKEENCSDVVEAMYRCCVKNKKTSPGCRGFGAILDRFEEELLAKEGTDGAKQPKVTS